MGRFDFALVVLLIALASGCKRARERAFEQRAREATGAEKVTVEEDGKRVTLSDKRDGGDTEVELGQSARIPADFPKNVPIYPGSKIVAAVATTENGKRSHVVTLSAAAPSTDVYEFYKRRLPAFGTIDEVSLGGIRMLSAKDGKGTTVSVMVTSIGANESTVQLTASPS